MVIHPYKFEGVWVFDDPKVDLVREAFVSGADDIIDLMVRELNSPEDGFNLFFSRAPFPGYQHCFARQHEEFDGWWYTTEKYNISGWLCPALFKYFDQAPANLYALVKNT